MSYSNTGLGWAPDGTTLTEKRRRKIARQNRKLLAARRIPHLGIIISKRIVKNQRYLRDHKLPYSRRIAEITLPGDLTGAKGKGMYQMSPQPKVQERSMAAPPKQGLFKRLTKWLGGKR